MPSCPCGAGYTETAYRDGDSEWDLLKKIATSLSILAGAAVPSGTPGTSSSFATAPDITVLVAGTAVAGLDIPTPRGVLVSAKSGNAGPVYVGGVGTSNNGGGSRGIELLQGGMAPVALTVSNLNQIYVNADNAGDRVGIVIL